MTDDNQSLLTVPSSPESERAVIGAVLIDPESYFAIASFLKAEDFFVHRHRWIWEAIVHLVESRTAVDYLTLQTALESKGRLAEIGGPAYLAGIINSVPSSLNAVDYAHIIEDAATRRRLISAANEVAKLAYDETEPLENVLEQSERRVFDVGTSRPEDRIRTHHQILSQIYDQVTDRYNTPQKGMLGISTGLIDLDRLLSGLQDDDFIVVAARPGVGKTSLLLSIIKHVISVEKKRTFLASLEMSAEQMMYRLVSQETSIDALSFLTGRLTNAQWDDFIRGIETLNSTSDLIIDDTPALSVLQLRAKAMRLSREERIDLLMVDYLQLMWAGIRVENRTQEVGYISRQLKALARDLHIPVVAAAQLNRALEQRGDKAPQLNDLRDSGEIEQDADVVIFLHKPDPKNPAWVTVTVAKHRHGPKGQFDLYFDEGLTLFRNAAIEKKAL